MTIMTQMSTRPSVIQSQYNIKTMNTVLFFAFFINPCYLLCG